MARKRITKLSNVQLHQIVALLLGVAILAVECWLNAEYALREENGASLYVAFIVIFTCGATAALPIAERVAKAGHYGKVVMLLLGFIPATMFSMTSAIERVGARMDSATVKAHTDNWARAIKQEAYSTALKAKEAECAIRVGKRCRELEAKLEGARKALEEAPVERIEDPMAKRVAAVLRATVAPSVTTEQVATWQPLAAPIGMQLFSIVFFAIAFMSGRKETQPESRRKRRNTGTRKPRRPRKSKAQAQVVPFRVNDNRATN